MSTSSNIITLRILLALLILVIFAMLTGLYFVRKAEQKKTGEALNFLRYKDKNLEMMEQSFQKLYEADNDFRMYTLTYDHQYFMQYSRDIHELMMTLDSLRSGMQPDSTETDLVTEASETILRKKNIAFHFIRLKRLTDSLLYVALSMDSLKLGTLPQEAYNIKRYYPDLRKMGLDTLSISSSTITEEKKKKGFFAKVKDFFKGSSEKTTTTTQEIRITEEGDTISETIDTTLSVDQVSQVIAGQTNIYYQKQLRLQKTFRQQMEKQEKALILTNKTLMDDLREILQILDDQVEERNDLIHRNAIGVIDRSARVVNMTTLLTLFIIGLLLFLMILTIRKIITYQKQIIDARKKALDEAADKSRFLAFMSHELRTPLTSIIGFSEQLKQTPLDATQQTFITSMRASSEMLLTTVNDILDLSKLEAGKMKFFAAPFRPDEVVKQVLSSLRPAAEQKGLEVFLHNNLPEKLTLMGDEMRLKQVLINVINNAIKYTEKGRITVSLSSDPCESKQCLNVQVADTGIGIPKNRLEDVFSEYSQVHDQSAKKWIIGTGLGLPICKKIVDQQGGKIWAESQAMQGSTFIFVIPYPESLETTEEDISTDTAIDITILKGKKILIVDDTQINLILLDSILQKWGVQVDKAQNGKEALALAAKNHYDLILSDVNMPEMDGIEMTRKIRRYPVAGLAKTPVLILTANILQDEVEKFQQAGVSDYLMKPFLMNDLYRVIRKQLIR